MSGGFGSVSCGCRVSCLDFLDVGLVWFGSINGGSPWKRVPNGRVRSSAKQMLKYRSVYQIEKPQNILELLEVNLDISLRL